MSVLDKDWPRVGKDRVQKPQDTECRVAASTGAPQQEGHGRTWCLISVKSRKRWKRQHTPQGLDPEHRFAIVDYTKVVYTIPWIGTQERGEAE